MRMCYCIMSDDPIMRRESLDRLIEQTLPGPERVFNLRHLNGETASAFDILAQLQSWPQMGAEHVLVVVQDAQRLSTATGERLLKALPEVPDSGFLVFVVDTTDQFKLPACLKTEVEKRKGMYRVGGTSKNDKVSVATKFVNEMFRGAGVPVSPSIVSEMVDRIGPSPLTLSRECQKVIDYVKTPEGTREPTGDDLDLLLIPTAEDVTFKLVDAVCEGRESKAIEYIRSRMANTEGAVKDEVHKIVSLIYRQLLLMWQTKVLVADKVNLYEQLPDDATRVLAIPKGLDDDGNPIGTTVSLVGVLSKNSWQARKLTNQVRHVSWEWLVESIRDMSDLRRRLESTEWADDDPELMLSLGVMSMYAGGSYAR